MAIMKLQRPLNDWAGLVTGKDKWTTTQKLMEECKWSGINRLISYSSMLEMWKVMNTNNSSYWRQRLRLVGEGGEGRNRSKQMGRIWSDSNPRWKLTKNLWRHRTVTLWNQLPRELTLEVKLGVFKRGLKKWIANNINFHPMYM